jgi:hypothetical protein
VKETRTKVAPSIINLIGKPSGYITGYNVYPTMI